MQTEGRTRQWVTGRRRGDPLLVTTRPPGAGPDADPEWEIAPRGHVPGAPAETSARRDAQLRRGLAAVDVLAAFASLLIVTLLIDPGQAHMQLTTILVAPLTVLAAKLMGLYDRDANVLGKTTIDEVPSLAYLAVVYALGAWLLEAVLLDGYLERSQVFGLLLLMLILDATGRLLVRRIAFALTPAQRCIVIGDAVDADRIATKLAGAPSVNALVVGRVPLHPAGDQVEDSTIPRLGDYETLARIVAEHHVERAIIAAQSDGPQSDGQDEILDAIRLMKALQVKVSVLPRLLEVVGSTSTFDDVDGLWLLGVRRYGLGRSSELIKRATDIATASVGLVIFGPLLLTLMLAVKLDSPGPVFFRQSRIGQRGERFWMLKLRSMVVDAEARKADLQQRNEAQGGMFKISDDPRITRVGRVLRRTSLDELPQLLNVLTGDMSLVGPRPLIPDEDSLITGWQRRRLSLRPGMTGLWQIFGSSRIPMNEMVKIDYLYGANWSLWLDLRILLRTIPYVLSRRGL
jgi:exopolysaccharide biosynthesis polyprenyl glycosylphosphotransferase